VYVEAMGLRSGKDGGVGLILAGNLRCTVEELAVEVSLFRDVGLFTLIVLHQDQGKGRGKGGWCRWDVNGRN
jgi:hypothetical protein